MTNLERTAFIQYIICLTLMCAIGFILGVAL